MDPLELLKSDHEKIRALIQQIDSSDETRIKKHILQDLRDEVLAHSELERVGFYPFFKKFPEMLPLLDRSTRDHQKIDDLANQLVGHERAYEELRGWIAHHFEEEENELFPKVRQVLRKTERADLGRRLAQLKIPHSKKVA